MELSTASSGAEPLPAAMQSVHFLYDQIVKDDAGVGDLAGLVHHDNALRWGMEESRRDAARIYKNLCKVYDGEQMR